MDSILGSFGMGTALPRLDRTIVWCIFLRPSISFPMYASLYSSFVADCQTGTSRFRLLSPSPLQSYRRISPKPVPLSLCLVLPIQLLYQTTAFPPRPPPQKNLFHLSALSVLHSTTLLFHLYSSVLVFSSDLPRPSIFPPFLFLHLIATKHHLIIPVTFSRLLIPLLVNRSLSILSRINLLCDSSSYNFPRSPVFIIASFAAKLPQT